jgi:hypothetical protein
MVFDMKNVLEELYNGNVHPLEDIPYTKQMKEVIGYVSRHKETLQGLLDDKGKETLEKLVDNFYEYCSLLSRETFHYSIRLGANLIIGLTNKGEKNE